MNRNVESHFSYLPTAQIGRSRFDRSHSVKTTCNAGEVIPFYIDEVLPGDTFSVDTSKVVRLQTPVTPFMDNVYMDTYYFFCPNRLVWEHWKNFMGEQAVSPWIDNIEYTPPVIEAPSGGWNVGTIADYFGIPTGVSGIKVQALPFRAYARVMDEWFRDENVQTPLAIPYNDTDITGSNGSNQVTDIAKGGTPFIANKYHDYFTSCLPAPQRGPDVPIPAGTVTTKGTTPVFGNGYGMMLYDGDDGIGGIQKNIDYIPSNPGAAGASATGSDTLDSAKVLGLVTKDYLDSVSAPYENTGLVTDLGLGEIKLSLGTISELRTAFQMQKFYEKLALNGSRYIEVIKGMFGVDSPDARLQRTEYLGGDRVALNINQVVQTSATQAQTGLTSTPLATVSAYSQTATRHSDFTKSFTEHGFVIGVCVVRYDHSYQQGLPRMFTRKDKFEYYWPVFANLSNQPILNREIYCQGPSAVNPDTGIAYDDEVFGYQEAWADYRYMPNKITGEMRSSYAQSLDIWHLGDDYNALPHLSADWMREDKSNIDRVLTVQSSSQDQIFMDIFVRNIATRPMPLYSIPGLIDHH